ncbi:MAG: RagB/SusD family nutrient uptake outer membrane protein [Chitinophagaceae bacterium]
MKKVQLYIVAMALAVVSATGCKKFLDEKPLTQVTTDGYFKSLNDVNASMAGVYGAFQEAMTGTGSGFSGFYHYWGESRSDNFDKGQYGASNELELTMNQVTSNNKTANWTVLYKTIGRANTCIKYIPQAQQYDNRVTNTIRDNNLAQCYAMRAVCYFYIARVWGDAVVWTEPYEDYTIPSRIPRSKKDSVIDNVIIPDLQKAYSLIQKNQTPTVWYLNEAAICAALADVYMWKKDYTNAVAWIQKVFAAKGPKGTVLAGTSGANLEPAATWKNLFINPTTTNEALWSINWDFTYNDCACLAISIATSNNTLAVDAVLHTAWKAQTGDIRPKWTYDTLTGTGHIDKVVKYYNITGNSFPTGTGAPLANTYNVYLVMYRLGDVYLSYAEALNKLHDKTNALKYLNFIRVRAGLAALDINDASIDTENKMEDVILQERQYELFAEGKRWFDLVRTDHVKKIMDPVLLRRQLSYGSELKGFGDDMNKVLWPILRQNLEDNKALAQNPSYN